MPLGLLHERCVCPLLHQLHIGWHTWDLRARLPSLSLLQLQTYSSFFLSSLPAGSLTSFLSEPRDSVPLLKTSMAEPRELLGQALHPSWQTWVLSGAVRGQRAHGLWCRGRELGGTCVWGWTWAARVLEHHPAGTIIIPQSEPCCWGRAASSLPGSSGNQIHNRAEEVRVPPLSCQELNSDMGRRLRLFDDF